MDRAFWSITKELLFSLLQTEEAGLTKKEALLRKKEGKATFLTPNNRSSTLVLFIRQFNNPLIFILLGASALSWFLGNSIDPIIILVIVLISTFLSFWQEKGAKEAVSDLLSLVQVKVQVLRDKKEINLPLADIVPGDIVFLSAGDLVPADCYVLSSKDFFVDESTITGETLSALKKEGVLLSSTPVSMRSNALFMGSHVVSGLAKVVVVFTGKNTEFGEVVQNLQRSSQKTDFEHRIQQFGYYLMTITFALVLSLFLFNLYFHRPFLQSLLFAVALAIGLTPQLLPMIISVNLAHGAKKMAKKKVIVKKLVSLENFGSMNILCSDKTGTLTVGKISLESAVDIHMNKSEKTLLYSYVNATFQTGYVNPIDQALLQEKVPIASWKKLDEIPYDFLRKRLSIFATDAISNILITKGALKNILEVSSYAEVDGKIQEIALVKKEILHVFEKYSSLGYRILGLAYRKIPTLLSVTHEEEKEMIFVGFLLFQDPVKEDVVKTIGLLQNLGVSLKIITGDNRFVASYVGKKIGFSHPRILVGSDLLHMSDTAFWNQVSDIDIFAEIDPNQKEKIISFLKKRGNVVGYMGDGFNDAPALHAADVSISVEQAVDIVKESSDIILLEKNLAVLAVGVMEGRKTFANTMKYIFMATSANFGNMFSMAGASLFLPFLPMLPKQVLLTNLLTDFPEMAIATDSVDKEMVSHPVRMDLKFIQRFMIVFGLISSVFDYLTFFLLIYVFKYSESQFQTGWFIESVLSASLITLVIRTRKPFYKSLPGKYLALSVFSTVIFTLLVPYTPLGRLFSFSTDSWPFALAIVGILILYILFAECAKKIFYKGLRKKY
ncbi:MAG: magnesium-translocating P-type ATPase [Chlamydiota bacterium]